MRIVIRSFDKLDERASGKSDIREMSKCEQSLDKDILALRAIGFDPQTPGETVREAHKPHYVRYVATQEICPI